MFIWRITSSSLENYDDAISYALKRRQIEPAVYTLNRLFEMPIPSTMPEQYPNDDESDEEELPQEQSIELADVGAVDENNEDFDPLQVSPNSSQSMIQNNGASQFDITDNNTEQSFESNEIEQSMQSFELVNIISQVDTNEKSIDSCSNSFCVRQTEPSSSANKDDFRPSQEQNDSDENSLQQPLLQQDSAAKDTHQAGTLFGDIQLAAVANSTYPSLGSNSDEQDMRQTETVPAVNDDLDGDIQFDQVTNNSQPSQEQSDSGANLTQQSLLDETVLRATCNKSKAYLVKMIITNLCQ